MKNHSWFPMGCCQLKDWSGSALFRVRSKKKTHVLERTGKNEKR
jgi:hypothetical protein